MKLIIDTDMGIDDACALILALSRPEVEILAITAVFGNVTVEQAVANASRVRKLMGRDKVRNFVLKSLQRRDQFSGPHLRWCSKAIDRTYHNR